MVDNVKIISYLNILELATDKPISEEIVKEAYRKLAQIYHPDVANARYKDGKKFIQLKEARDFLIDNIDSVNSLIRNGFSSSSSSAYSRSNDAYERWKQEEEFKRRKAEEDRIKKEQEEAEKRRQEEIRKRKEAEEKKKR